MKRFEVQVTHTITVVGTVFVRAADSESAEKEAIQRSPEVTWVIPDGWDSDDTLDAEVMEK